MLFRRIIAGVATAVALVALPSAAQAGAETSDRSVPGRVASGVAPGGVRAEPSEQDRAFLHAANEINAMNACKKNLPCARMSVMAPRDRRNSPFLRIKMQEYIIDGHPGPCYTAVNKAACAT